MGWQKPLKPQACSPTTKMPVRALSVWIWVLVQEVIVLVETWSRNLYILNSTMCEL